MINRDQLIRVLKNGDVNVDSRLILKTDGNFELVPFETSLDAENFDDLNYVTRWRTFDERSGCVGEDALKDQRHIDDIIRWAEQAWGKYKSTGRTRITNFD